MNMPNTNEMSPSSKTAKRIETKRNLFKRVWPTGRRYRKLHRDARV